MPQGDGTGPRGQGPRSRKNAGRCNPRGRNASQQCRGGRDAGSRQSPVAGQGAGRGQGRGQGRGKSA